MSNTDLTEWRVIPQYPDYAVSSCGDVKRVTPSPFSRIGLIMKPGIMGKYRAVNLWRCGKHHHAYIHRLVATVFLENPHNLRCVRHLDGDKFNNSSRNLAWGSHSDNMADMVIHGRTTRGDRNSQSILTSEQVREIRQRHDGKYGTGRALAKEFGVSPATVSVIKSGKNWAWLD